MSQTLTKQDVLELVRKHVNADQPQGYKLVVLNDIRFVSDGLTDPDECFFVVVQTDTEPQRRLDYYDKLGELQEKIEAAEGFNVMLVPAMPG